MSEIAACLHEFLRHPNSRHNDNPELWLELAREEHRELEQELEAAAAGEADPAGIAREAADVVYLAYGVAAVNGIDLDEALREIHRAAMDKMRAGIRGPNGKMSGRVLWRSRPGRASFGRTAGELLAEVCPLKVWLELLLEPRDLWVGAYWTVPDVAWRRALDVYVAVIPCLPLRFMFRWAGWAAAWHTARRRYTERRLRREEYP